LGEWYQNKSKYSESAVQYWEAIKLAQKIKDKSIESAAYNGLGITYYLQNDLQKAEEFVQKAAQLRYEIEDFTYYSVLLSNLAVIYIHNSQFDKSIALLRQAEQSLLKQPEGDYMASLYNTLGASYQMAYPEKDSAIYYYRKGLEVAKRFNVQLNIMTGYHNLGEDALRKRNFEEALNYLYMALEISKTLENDSYIMRIHSTLSEAYANKGDFKKALEHKIDELVLSNQIFETEKQKAIKELEFKYETAVKDQKLIEQEEVIQKSLLEAEREMNKRNRFIFTFLIAFLIFAFWLIYMFQKRKAKEKLEAEKSKIFENIVHDIRTPLTLIKGPIEVIKNQNLNPEIHSSLKVIDVQSEKLLSLVNELLDASKLEKGKYIPVWKIGNPNVELERLVEGLEEAIAEKNISLKVISLEIDNNVNYPSDVFEKVLSNLLSNALKFTPLDGDIKVEGKLENKRIKISVFNSGSTLTAQEKERVFERFYRLEQHQHVSGSGIGLSVSKDLLDLVNGSISVENVNKGVVFTFSFEVELLSLEDTIQNEAGKPLLLVVEDDKDIRTFVASLLSDSFSIVEAENGKRGYELAQEILPDIIVTDILMPELNGLEMLHLLKKNALTETIPVVVCSSKKADESRIQGLTSGASAYVSKPFHPEELKLTLKNIWQQETTLRERYKEQTKAELPCRERLLSTNNFVNKAVKLVMEQIENAEYEVNQLTHDVHLSRSQLHRKLTQFTGMSATQFIKMVRIEQAKDFLKSGTYNVTETAYKCGFNSQSYFSKSFQEYTGKSPSSYTLMSKGNNNAT
jgi:signal transduction histidine kinase/DNA-binding response OmpR family regulator